VHSGANEAITRGFRGTLSACGAGLAHCGTAAPWLPRAASRAPPGIPGLTWLFACRFSDAPVADDTVHPGLSQASCFIASGHALHHSTIYCRYFLILGQVTGVSITRLDLVTGVRSTGEATDMSLWLIPVGIAAWFLVAIVAGLCVGPVLGRCSQARKAADQPWMRASGTPSRRARTGRSRPGCPVRGAGIAKRDQNVTR